MSKVINAMVDRFLCWELPKDFAPDCGISFDGRHDDDLNRDKTWPVGTNLFTAEQAKQMFRDVMPTESEFLSLEKQYAERLGRLAQLCDVVIPAVRYTYLELGGRPDPEVISAMCEIMDYVDAVRP